MTFLAQDTEAEFAKQVFGARDIYSGGFERLVPVERARGSQGREASKEALQESRGRDWG